MELSLPQLVAAGRIAPDWAEALAPVAEPLARLDGMLRAERAAGARVLPADERILAAFERPLGRVRAVIVGQDPYPTPGHAIGLAFATERSLRPLPRSLRNIYRELSDDLGIPPAQHGDLGRWAAGGVLLLNRVLTVRAGSPGSHRALGWEEVTSHAIRALVARRVPLVAMLWGADARRLGPLFGDAPRIESAHPSPLSASRGFFGSRPFSRANAALAALGAEPIDWRVDADEQAESGRIGTVDSR